MWMFIGAALVHIPTATQAARAKKLRPAYPPGRYTRFGYRLGHADGPWRMGEAGTGSRELVANAEEQAIVHRIISECDGSGPSAVVLARKLREEGVMHPRLHKPWRPGSIVMIYGTQAKHRDAGLMDMIAMAMTNEIEVPRGQTF